MLNEKFDWHSLGKKGGLTPSNEKHIDLREVLKKGSYIIDGILNQTFYIGKRRCINGETTSKKGRIVPNEDGPTKNEKAWRHAVAVKDGVVHEWTGDGINHKIVKYKLKWLWLGNDGVTPDPTQGYMRHILKVYRISPKV